MSSKKIIYFFAAVVLSFTACKKDGSGLYSEQVSPKDFLSASKYEKLIVEIRYISGFEPTQQAQNNLIAFLNARLNKPEVFL